MTLSVLDLAAIAELVRSGSFPLGSYHFVSDARRLTLASYFADLAQQAAQRVSTVAEIKLRPPVTALCDICEGELTDNDDERCPHCGTVWATPPSAEAIVFSSHTPVNSDDHTTDDPTLSDTPDCRIPDLASRFETNDLAGKALLCGACEREVTAADTEKCPHCGAHWTAMS
jgi:uncharacterized CHY-type Zn-finger protein